MTISDSTISKFDELHSVKDGANPKVVEMFDRISSTYDRLNRFFSLGVDRLWRRAAVKSLELAPGQRILDCSAGTGDMSFEAHRQCRGIHTTMYDPAAKMLALADEKARRLEIKNYDLQCGAAEIINSPNGSYDRFMVAFGIRNFRDLEGGMTELNRILKPGGKGVVLEFTPDRSKLIDAVFKSYMWWVMRPIGGAVSDDREAYKYLAETIRHFPPSPRLIAIFRASGFTKVESTPLSFGIATRFLLTK